ncbi:hypothetical protein PIB30_018830 [Stylosanthes scabra]|uniref:Uncharacterized protein n=1 Tax=Stylosanthes scabra TaxID=79078 RepID=A0ABU6T7T1_9FABA|nr:hypothetical protein [Stylosanthes scabra]
MLSESENDEMPNGWPLGLGFLNIRLRVTEAPSAAPVEPFSSMHAPSTSFSSFSSSNLDTESTASFFQDKSVSLGRLIGIRGGERGRLYFTNTLRFEDSSEKKTLGDETCSESDSSKVQEVDVSDGGICILTLLDVLLRISTKTKRTSRN